MDSRARSMLSTTQDELAPNSMKALGENKLRAFEQGTITINTRTNLSRKEREDLRAKIEASETEEALKEFVAAFEEPKNKINKTFIKGGVFNPGSHEETPSDRGKTYRASTTSNRKDDSIHNKDNLQQQIAKSNAAALAAAAAVSAASENKPKLKTEREKRKSNLESFKEELKRIQEERDRRHMQKQREKEGKSTRFQAPPSTSLHSDLALDSDSLHHESRHSSDDPNTTNLFINTIPRSMNETSIMELFGRYGPLASVKIMYPRSDEEKSRGTNCGFVAYMSRKDAERAMHELNGTQLDSISVRMSWGRPVHIPPQPVYIPPTMRELIMPPPPSGLPFNAQPNTKYRSSKLQDILSRENELSKLLEHATIRVIIPHDRALLCLIHRMIEFVIREGPLFEAMIMRREMNNPQFRFLFDNQSPAHTYYRWKLYSILQGDSVTSWRTEAFRLFKMGSLWLPPQPQQFTSGMPDEVFEKVKRETETETNIKAEVNVPVINQSNTSNKRGRLSHRQRDHFEDLLRQLTPERIKIGDAMIWAIDHAEAADEIIDCITESLSILQTPTHKKISRLYLISDILHNCSVKVTNASHYRRGFEVRLPDIFQHIHQAWSAIDGRLRAEQFKQKVMSSFRAWESWAIYPSDFLIKLQNIFLGLVRSKTTTENEMKKPTFDDDIDGKPINLESSDNRPLALVADYDDEEDIDGKPMSIQSSSIDDDIDGRPLNTIRESRPRFQEEIEEIPSSSSTAKPGFVPTKWESVDPTQTTTQGKIIAVTVSKWDFDQESTIKGNESLYEDLAETSRTSSDNNNNTNNDEYIRNSSSSSTHNVDNTIAPDSLSTSDTSEERRQKLRDIEIQVLKYTDELESGRLERAYGLSLAEEIEIYRQNLLKKLDVDEKSTTVTSPDSSKSTNRTSISNKQQYESSASSSSSSRNNSSRYSQQRSIDEKNQETSSRRDDSSSRHRLASTRSNSSNSNQSESARSSTSRTTTDHHHHHQHKRKRDERSPSPSSRHSRSSRR
ncbi:unnamed protein product [Rotaria sordida]|uniref:U2 snRNP-associated SURP motif-containing protein n=3 Tax=Rotaria sordida TaxID=392033 RepID=A0A813T582_9BILA|nr:unnamed protein product [Rotaria sordida]